MDNRDWPFPDKFHLRWRVSSAAVRFATVLVVQTVLSKSVHVFITCRQTCYTCNFCYKTFLCNNCAASLAWPDSPLCQVRSESTKSKGCGFNFLLRYWILILLHERCMHCTYESHVITEFAQRVQIKNMECLQKVVWERPRGTPLVTISNHSSCMDDPVIPSEFELIRIVDRLTDWKLDRIIDQLTAWIVNSLSEWVSDWPTDRPTDRPTDQLTD